jgi:hypothetical protein
MLADIEKGLPCQPVAYFLQAQRIVRIVETQNREVLAEQPDHDRTA